MKPEQLQLKNCWEGFAAVAIPEGAPQAQREAMYQAFLAGCTTVLQLHKSCTQHTPSNVKGVMEAWQQEVDGELRRLGEAKQ